MVDKKFIESLFDKHEVVSEDEKKKVEDILYEVKEQEVVEKVVDRYEDHLNLAQQIVEAVPLFYDDSCIWWKWNFKEFKWQIIDEIDLMNIVAFSSPAHTVNSKVRSEVLQGLKQVARAKRPLLPKDSVIQFKDQVVDLKTGEKIKANNLVFLTNPIPYKIGKNDKTPNIDKIFAEWVGEENVLLLKEIISYCMLRDYPIHRIFCFIGSGLNGKSKYLELLRKFIGPDNVCSTELDTLLTSRFEVTRLHKKLVCQMGETNFNEMSKTSILKKLSGGDLIGFEYKNKNPFEDKNYAKILIATNNLPTTTDKTKGFYRRWVIIDFPNEFSEKKDILADIPEEEYESLANQLVSILMNLTTKREFHNEGSIEDRMKKYEDHSNPLEKFISEYTEEDYNGFIWKFEFEKTLNEWCRENRFREISSVAIGKKMKQIGISQEHRVAGDFASGKQLRAWCGIKFKEGIIQVTQEKQAITTSSHGC